MTELAGKSIGELQKLLETKQCSSVDIATDVLGAIDAHDGRIQGYVQVDAAQALREAHASDARRASGQAGKLEGIPVAVKDVLNVSGQPCTCGSNMLKGYTAPYDATAIAALRREGAVLLGRTNMDEFAMGSSTENSAYGPTRNPWNAEYVPGGSSGGAAAVVAADEAIVAIGSDTGGSVRQPASFCGCVGLKPSYGRVSRYGLTAYASSLDQIGPLSKTVADAALLLEVMAGHDARDSSSIPAEVPAYSKQLTTDVKGIRIGIPKEYFIEGIDPEVERCVRDAIEQCRVLGAEIVPVELPHTEYAIATYYIIATAEASANLARFDGVRYGARVAGSDPIDMYMKSRAAGFGSEVKRRIILGTYVLSSGYYDAYYGRAQKVRRLIADDFSRAFELCDCLACPVAPGAAYRLGSCSNDPLKMYLGDIFTVTANLAGICGLSVPCGFTADGLPVGMQLLGPSFGEQIVLNLGHAYEQSMSWTARRPGC